MDWDYYKRLTREGENKYDFTSLFEDAEAFSNLIADFKALQEGLEYDRVAGLEAMGLILAGALCARVGKPLVCIRKGSKLPFDDDQKESVKVEDYSGEAKRLEVMKTALKPGDKVLLVDDWIETGGQMEAAVALIQRLGGEVAGIIVIGAEKTRDNESLFAHGVQALTVSDKR